VTTVSEKGWVGWITANKLTSALLAVVLVTMAVGIGIVANRSGSNKSNNSSNNVSAGPQGTGTTVAGLNGPGPGSQPTSTLASTTTGGTITSGTTTGTSGGTSTGSTSGSSTGGATTGTSTTGGTTTGSTGCVPAADSETGVSKTEIRVGQIISDVSQLPAQLKPTHEGLEAYVNMVNAAGGICGRKIVIDYTNDGSNPATHDYQQKIHQDFAFVGNSSLIDSVDYQGDAPFNPMYQDKGEYVPDVGGLAYSYGRNQSPWYASPTGSLSPSLVGGLGFKYFTDTARAAGKPCRKAGVAYLREPTGASLDQAQLGGRALAALWGGNLGATNVKYFINNLADPEPVYEQTIRLMVAAGVNCVFTYSDLGSDINLVKAAATQGVWPPSKCSLGPKCFSVLYVPFAAYDPKLIHQAGDAALGVSTFIPHIPLNETSGAPMQTYLKWLKTVQGATPSTFSLLGWSAGDMFAGSLRACGAAPTRLCLMQHLRALQNFDAGGLFGPDTPFRTTRVNCAGGCGNFSGKGVYNFKWIFVCSVGLQVADRNGVRDFYRTHPGQGYTCDSLRVVRGAPA
jgi:Periplasmic binding protein